ncbi:MAG: MBOAT family O-acyltransferase [Chloroflexota bacterium]
MTVAQILLLLALAALIGLTLRERARTLFLAGFSALVLFWLSPPDLLIPSLPFWLPVLTIFLVILVWTFTAPIESRRIKENWPALAVMAVAILLAVALRILPINWMTNVVIPPIQFVVVALLLFGVIAIGLASLKRGERIGQVLGILGTLLIFIVLKSPWLTRQFFELSASLRGQPFDVDPTRTLSVAWLGYSYVAFRLLHVVRDRQAGILPAATLDEFLCYVIFFPSITAGPIDRLERFLPDLRAPSRLTNDDWLNAGTRLALGLFKKFVLADGLAWLSISDALVKQTGSPGWLWLFLYAYTLRLYFDFSGYTDIAIGTARLMGIRLPENFDSPYLKSNLTQFWNSWHITLTQWFRAYVFNPLTRFLRSSKINLPIWLIILTTQLVTMSLIGLWHGITWNFLFWGLWHGLGLFLQNRWSDIARTRFPNLGATPPSRNLLAALGVFLTFNYFALGLVFFSLSSLTLSFTAFMKLFGMA